MKSKIAIVLSLMALLTIDSFADESKTKKENLKIVEVKEKPVDEALENSPKEDTIKGGGKVEDTYHYKEIFLSKIDKNYRIIRENLHFPPYRCFIYHSNNGSQEDIIKDINSSKIDITIPKDKLKVGDRIFIINNLEANNIFKKFVVEEIEIIK